MNRTLCKHYLHGATNGSCGDGRTQGIHTCDKGHPAFNAPCHAPVEECKHYDTDMIVCKRGGDQSEQCNTSRDAGGHTCHVSEKETEPALPCVYRLSFLKEGGLCCQGRVQSSGCIGPDSNMSCYYSVKDELMEKCKHFAAGERCCYQGRAQTQGCILREGIATPGCFEQAEGHTPIPPDPADPPGSGGTVTVPDLSLDRMHDLIGEVCDEVKIFLQEKNKSYGNAVTEPVQVFSKLDMTDRINVRIDDKLQRIAKGNEYALDDTLLDLIGYLILKRCIEKDS